MISKKLFDKVGDILDVIGQLAESRNALVELYQRYKHPLSFINNYLRNFPTSSRAWGGIIYRAAKYFGEQGDYLSLQDPNVPLDRRLAGQIPLPDSKPGMAYGYRYNLQVDIAAPWQGFMRTFNFWVDSTGFLSENEVLESAYSAIVQLMDKYKLTDVIGMTNSFYVDATSIQSFVQYNPMLNNG